MSEEPELLCQESKRLQTVVQNTQADLTHSREKVTQKLQVWKMIRYENELFDTVLDVDVSTLWWKACFEMSKFSFTHM